MWKEKEADDIRYLGHTHMFKGIWFTQMYFLRTLTLYNIK